ncbi:MAG: protein-disulfide reductase DsbD [Proteobacteria bacterium]|nr:protein-disulfide reductase DsbD [Pseudomonadota bacterium]
MNVRTPHSPPTRSPSLLALLWRLALMLVMGCSGAARAQDFLPVDQAFQVSVQASGPRALQVAFTLAPAVYLYRERFEATLQPAGGAPQPLGWDLPPGKTKHDPNFGRDLEVYHGDVSGGLGLPAGLQGDAILTVGYQGCADAGLCYPPQKRRFQLQLDAQGQIVALRPLRNGLSAALGGSGVAAEGAGQSPMPAATEGGGSGAGPGGDRIRQALDSGRVWTVLPVFLLAGVLLSLTPCVLPMVPILSSIIVGQRERVSRGRGLALALSYSQGMALVYTALGVAAGLLGQGLAAYLQHPWVVLGFGALMVLLALSMFGLYELQLPAALQSWLGQGSSRLPGGKFVSVFAMGVVSALVVSPCVSAPLAGALLYISQTRDVWLGGGALYALAWGMSLPLLLVGLSAGSVLPRTGPWMKAVKALFGVIMLGMALWVSRPAWPYLQTQVLGMASASAGHRSVLPFQRVRNMAELDAALAQARADGRAAMLDFYADWCTSCLEMEHNTFTDALVQSRLKGVVLLQADVTLNSPEDRALLERFRLFGPPGIIFFDPQGGERPDARVIGYQAPQDFIRNLQRAGL